ncbi:hypothetical protein DFP72DRAFT_875451, partial [Ephemerocybe angulata]
MMCVVSWIMFSFVLCLFIQVRSRCSRCFLALAFVFFCLSFCSCCFCYLRTLLSRFALISSDIGTFAHGSSDSGSVIFIECEVVCVVTCLWLV